MSSAAQRKMLEKAVGAKGPEFMPQGGGMFGGSTLQYTDKPYQPPMTPAEAWIAAGGAVDPTTGKPMAGNAAHRKTGIDDKDLTLAPRYQKGEGIVDAFGRVIVPEHLFVQGAVPDRRHRTFDQRSLLGLNPMAGGLGMYAGPMAKGGFVPNFQSQQRKSLRLGQPIPGGQSLGRASEFRQRKSGLRERFGKSTAFGDRLHVPAQLTPFSNLPGESLFPRLQQQGAFGPPMPRTRMQHPSSSRGVVPEFNQPRRLPRSLDPSGRASLPVWGHARGGFVPNFQAGPRPTDPHAGLPQQIQGMSRPDLEKWLNPTDQDGNPNRQLAIERQQKLWQWTAPQGGSPWSELERGSGANSGTYYRNPRTQWYRQNVGPILHKIQKQRGAGYYQGFRPAHGGPRTPNVPMIHAAGQFGAYTAADQTTMANNPLHQYSMGPAQSELFASPDAPQMQTLDQYFRGPQGVGYDVRKIEQAWILAQSNPHYMQWFQTHVVPYMRKNKIFTTDRGKTFNYGQASMTNQFAPAMAAQQQQMAAQKRAVSWEQYAQNQFSQGGMPALNQWANKLSKAYKDGKINKQQLDHGISIYKKYSSGTLGHTPQSSSHGFAYANMGAQRGGFVPNFGVFQVPGTGNGDTVNANVPEGSFVLNKKASAALMGARRGGETPNVPVRLEPGELVVTDPTPAARRGLAEVNADIPRFQEGGDVLEKRISATLSGNQAPVDSDGVNQLNELAARLEELTRVTADGTSQVTTAIGDNAGSVSEAVYSAGHDQQNATLEAARQSIANQVAPVNNVTINNNNPAGTNLQDQIGQSPSADHRQNNYGMRIAKQLKA